ncbi:TIGR02281 family clan AA aspartic protease [Aestuariibacter sp. AA17]|uniref:TIGR02281 family clan AA aspartic protease n=1 Tax=Fluctibacter corallii TaxID=2984329 RepID=A0ABT3A8C4_9ALTE|nr:TIGR02281 family clan AA aspartic protease [Aestuariibacter sp. AA17]MCV2884921.1 TIGR02281 family clan AA aspartic protease [Aestuariibacter sp. AA17]
MQQDNTPDASTQGMGKGMIILAWLSAMGLLVLFFNDYFEKQMNPNQQPDSVTKGQVTEVSLKQNRQGHYVTTGTLNGHKVVFLLDTGATTVSIPAHLQAKLGLAAGYKSRASTANGFVTVASTSADSITIGDIALYNVSANLNPGMQGDEILLGMSALKQLEFTQRGEWLILRQY